MTRTSANRGFTLLEVLIAVLIFSIGMLGTAGMMVLSVRTNHSAYLRTQASFMAESMAERMRSNTGWEAAYTGTYDSTTAGIVDACESACTPAELVARDKALWSQQLKDQLPNGEAEITCGAVSNLEHQGISPYPNLCEMTITWIEADLSRTSTTPATQTFAWVFQP